MCGSGGGGQRQKFAKECGGRESKRFGAAARRCTRRRRAEHLSTTTRLCASSPPWIPPTQACPTMRNNMSASIAAPADTLQLRRLPRRRQRPPAQHGAHSRHARTTEQATAREQPRAVVAARRARQSAAARGHGRRQRRHGRQRAGVAKPPPGHVAGRRLRAGPGDGVQVGGLRRGRSREHGQPRRASARGPHRHAPEEVQLRVERLHAQGHSACERLCAASTHAQPHAREALLLHAAGCVLLFPQPECPD